MSNLHSLPLPHVNDLCQYLKIDPFSPSGLRWIKPVKPGRIKKGDVAGKQDKDGSWSVRFRCQRYRIHRIIYYLHTGEDPIGFLIDHIDLNPANNKVENLRKATNSTNQANTLKKTNLTSKYKGVSWSKQSKKWKAGIYINKKQKHLGFFDKEEDAGKAYDYAARQVFGQYAKLNFSAE